VKRVARHSPRHPSRRSTSQAPRCPGGEGRRVAGAGNATNPMAGFGMQQARRLASGASRRGGERPRGRNTIGQVALFDRRKAATPTGSGRKRERWWRGTQGELQERRAGNGPSRRGESLKESEGHAGCGPGARADVLARQQEHQEGGRREKPRRSARKRVRAKGAAGRAKDPRPDGRRPR